MRRDIKYTEGLSNKEIMYIVASEWSDEICMQAVADADEIMENTIVADIIIQAAEHLSHHDYHRKQKCLLGGDIEAFWYKNTKETCQAYKTVLYDTIFHKYGANNHKL